MEAAIDTMERAAPEEAGGLTRVQVGCGPLHLRADWWNTDLRGFEGVDEVMDATKPWRWQDALDYVYAEHFLEHLSFEDAIAFLTEAGNALKVGGRIRLTTPSLEWVIRTHFAFERSDVDTRIADTFRINRAFHGWGHAFLYSAPMLRRLLEEIGYHDVEFFGYGQSHDPVLRNLELHGDHSIDFGYPSVWIIEGTRSQGPIDLSPAFRTYADQAFGQYMVAGH